MNVEKLIVLYLCLCLSEIKSPNNLGGRGVAIFIQTRLHQTFMPHFVPSEYARGLPSWRRSGSGVPSSLKLYHSRAFPVFGLMQRPGTPSLCIKGKQVSPPCPGSTVLKYMNMENTRGNKFPESWCSSND